MLRVAAPGEELEPGVSDPHEVGVSVDGSGEDLEVPPLCPSDQERAHMLIRVESTDLDRIGEIEELLAPIPARVAEEEEPRPSTAVQVVETVREARVDLVARREPE